MSGRFVWLLIGVAVVVAGLLVFLQRDDEKVGSPANAATPTKAAPTDAAASSLAHTPPPSETEPAVMVQTPPIIDPETDKPLIEPLPLQKGELPWEARIRSVLSREKLTDAEKAHALLDLLPTMQAEGAETCAEEAVKRLPNSDYRFAQSVVTNPGTYGLALGVLFADMMDRPDNLRLPTLVTIARNSAHPYAAPALDNLELLIGKDYGTDWVRWDAAVREKLGAH